MKRISRKRRIQLGVLVLAILIVGGLLIANKFFNIFAAGNDITNTATIYYQEGGVDKSAQSNTVITAVTTPTPSPSPTLSPPPPTPSTSPPAQTMQIILTLQGRSDNSLTGGLLRLYNAGTSTLVFEKNDVSLPSSGQGQIAVSGLTSGQFYDAKFKAPYFLTSLVPNIQYNAGSFGAIFAIQLGGDLDNNNIINSIDFAILSSKWGQSDPVSDINKDGTVNTIDFSFLNSNWFKQGS